MRLSQLHAEPALPGVLAARALVTLAIGGRDESSREQFVRRQRHWSAAHRDQIPRWLIERTAIPSIDSAGAPGLTGSVPQDFAQVVDGLSILARLPGVKRAPLRTRMAFGASGTTARFVGENEPLPFGAIDLDSLGELRPHRVGGVAAITVELARATDGEAIVLADLSRATARAIDEAAFDPTQQGGGAAPASLTSQGTLINSAGNSVAQVAADLRGLIATVGALSDLHNAAWVMRASTAAYIATTMFQDVTTLGPNGSLLGLPLFTSARVTNDASPAEGFIALVDASEILVGDDGAVELDVSREAAAQMDDDPESGAQSQVSLWQQNLVGLRATRFLDWRLRRAGAVATLVGVTF